MLYACLRPDDNCRPVSYPYYAKYATEGDKTYFRHIDISTWKMEGVEQSSRDRCPWTTKPRMGARQSSPDFIATSGSGGSPWPPAGHRRGGMYTPSTRGIGAKRTRPYMVNSRRCRVEEVLCESPSRRLYTVRQPVGNQGGVGQYSLGLLESARTV